MIRIAMMVARRILHVPFWYYRICKYGDTEKYSEEERYSYLRMIGFHAVKVSRVNIICSGLENLPKENGYLITPNHQGMFDCVMFLYTHERPFNIVNKKEVRHFPVLGRVFDAFGALEMDREDVRQCMKVIIKMSEDIRNGLNYVIFPEGTRSKNGNSLGTFKGGTFKAATKVKAPIVPVAIIDSFIPFDRNSIRKCTTQIHYLPPLYYEDYKDMKTTEIAVLVHDMIQKKIDEELAKGNSTAQR